MSDNKIKDYLKKVGKLMILDMFVIGLVLSVFRNESIARDSSINLKALRADK